MQTFVNIAISLTAYLEQCAAKQFSWQKFNCGHFVLDWWDLITGEDTHSDVVAPTTVQEARQWIKNNHGTLMSELARRIGKPVINPLMAQIGDIVVLEDFPTSNIGVGTALGICNGRQAAVLGLSGVVFVPMHFAKRAFSIRGDHAVD